MSRDNLGIKRLGEVFEQKGIPTSQEWEDGYSEAIFEWERGCIEMGALLKALQVLDGVNFSRVWEAYENNLVERVARQEREWGISKSNETH